MSESKQLPATHEALEARLKQIEEERDAILKLLAIWKGHPLTSNVSAPPKVSTGSYSIRGRVVDAAIELIHKHGRQATNEEILAFVEEKGISLGSAKNKVTALGAILSQECEKNSARLKRVARGVYDLK